MNMPYGLINCPNERILITTAYPFCNKLFKQKQEKIAKEKTAYFYSQRLINYKQF